MLIKAIRLLNCLLFIAAASCGTDGDSRYRDTSMLERPPHMHQRPAAAETEQKEDGNTETDETKVHAGLGDQVWMDDSRSPSIRIKEGFDAAWLSVTRALKQRELTISDRNREDKVLYVKFDADDYSPDDAGILSSIASPFKNDYSEQTYLLKVESRGSETEITAELADKAEQGAAGDNTEAGASADGSLRLLKALFKTLHDDLKPE